MSNRNEYLSIYFILINHNQIIYDCLFLVTRMALPEFYVILSLKSLVTSYIVMVKVYIYIYTKS